MTTKNTILLEKMQQSLLIVFLIGLFFEGLIFGVP